ncbi:heavy metal translocating P-type ATPase [Domibacillus enclensis]|uniref:Cd2+/Zn2+-exporting ATPase n=1 Tax=Domibacillus enclensis TaxID=1017273 RepID=A0A1N6X2T2_9BACI|nr:heavy metal translocating P-type ATPase [Domibacillus enclensis]OXS78097.1 heavy metal translocating P-type ATPase [Domibacillus enclensis]SIQ96626.1 Cd2+/Zn2+-exporting ATPase [Domibacillus enclensis]
MTALTENTLPREGLLQKITPHLELAAALFSGLLILAGWLLDRNGAETASVFVYLSAFLIGGFAKAKEGIEATIKEKELNVEMLMILAAAGSAAIGYWTEGAILIFIFAVSGALETYTMNKSQREISALMDIQPDTALLVRDGSEEHVHVSELTRGDIIIVKPGERVPADGLISKGHTTIDEAAITGESIPVSKEAGADVFAGTVNMTGSVYIEVTKKADETLFQKIIELVQSAQSEKSPSQQFIERFEGSYVKVVLVIVSLMMFLPHFLLGWSWTETFYRAMVLLVVASPCALVASIMPATLSAISNGARSGILFKGGAHLENLSHIKAIAFDKTGTLTRGKPEVTDVVIRGNLRRQEILQAAASIESRSNHPLAHAVVRYAQQENILFSPPDQLEDVAGWGVKGTIGDNVWKIGKAAFVGKEEAAAFANGAAAQFAEDGKTTIYIADQEGIAAVIALKDIIREETKQALKTLQDEGIFTIMLTGDSEKTARAIASETALGSYIAECLPEQKVDHVKELLEKYGTVAMVGDGINDAPALATASVGIAMGEGSDVALETADVILMKNDLPKIAEAIQLSRKMQRIVKQNIIFSISVIVLLIISNFFQVLDLPFGVLGHEGSTILVILNGLRLLKT